MRYIEKGTEEKVWDLTIWLQNPMWLIGIRRWRWDGLRQCFHAWPTAARERSHSMGPSSPWQGWPERKMSYITEECKSTLTADWVPRSLEDSTLIGRWNVLNEDEPSPSHDCRMKPYSCFISLEKEKRLEWRNGRLSALTLCDAWVVIVLRAWRDSSQEDEEEAFSHLPHPTIKRQKSKNPFKGTEGEGNTGTDERKSACTSKTPTS